MKMVIEFDKVSVRLKEARNKVNLSREEMAERINASVTTIAKIESEDKLLSVKSEFFLGFCKECNVTPDYILYGYNTKTELGSAEQADQDLINKFNNLSVQDRAYIEDIINAMLNYRRGNKK